MEEKVEYVLKIIDEEGESFASRAEMYYRRRPEILNFVEDFFRSYRALAERFDHLSKDLQTANRTIATVYPERVQLAMEDEDGEQFLASLGPPKESNEPSKTLPTAPKLSFPKVPSFAKRNAKPSRLMSKKGLIKFNVDDAIAAARPSSGLKKPEALKEIDKLQKDILALQTEKEFIKSSYENGLARYWGIEEKVTEMQAKVSSLQDEFGIGTMIEDDEARSLMTATALNSCQDTLAQLQEKQKQSVEDVIAEHQKILEVLGKFETLKGKFVSNLPHPQVLSEVNKSSNPDSELKKLNPEKVHSKDKELETNSDTFMSDLAEKVDELVDKVINLESALSSQNAYVNRLRSETNELHSHLTKVEEEKGNLVEDSESMSKRIRQLEEELLRVQNLNESIKHNANQCSFDDISEKLHNKRQDEDVKDTLSANKVIDSGVDKAKQFQAHEAIIPGENVIGSSKDILGISRGVSSKEGLKKKVEQEGRLEVDQQNFVESHSNNDSQDGMTGGTLEADQGISGVDKAKQFQVHEAIISGTNVLGISKGVSSNEGLKKEVLEEQEGCPEVDQKNLVESHSSNNTQDGQTGGNLKANQSTSSVDKAKQFQVHEAIVPGTNVLGISKGVSTEGSLKKEVIREHEDCPEVDQKNFVESHSKDDTRDGKTVGTLDANQGVSGVNKAKQFQVLEAVIPGASVLDISKGISSKEDLKKEVLQEQEGCLEVDKKNLVGSPFSNDTRDGQGSGLTGKEMMMMMTNTTPHLVASEGVRVRGQTDTYEDQDHPGKAEYTYMDSNLSNNYNSFRSEDSATNQKNYYEGTEYVKSSGYDAMIKKQTRSGEEAKEQDILDNLVPFEGKEEKFPKADLQNDQDKFIKSTVEHAADVRTEKGFDKSQHGHVTDHGSATRRNDGMVELRGTNDSSNRSYFPGSGAVNQKKDTKGSECIRSPGYDAMISTEIRTGEEAKKGDILDNLIPFKGEAEKLSASNLQNDHDDLTKISHVKDAGDVKIEKGFDKSQQVHVTDHGSPTKKNVEQRGPNDLADRRDDVPCSVEDTEEKLYKTNHQNHLNDFFQEATSRDSPHVNMERGFDESERFRTSSDDLVTYVRKEEQARTKDTADKSDYLHIVEGKEEKLYKTHQNSLLRDSPEVKMEMRSDEVDLHVSDNDSAIRKDMRMEEQAGTKVNAEKSDRLHIPAEGKEGSFQKSNHPNYQYDLLENVPKDATNIKKEKAFHESERTHISDDSSAIREERTEALAVKDAPHESRFMPSSYEQQASRIDFADKFASSTSEEGRNSSNQESYFNDVLQVSPSGATLDGTPERGSNEVVHTTNPSQHDSTSLEDTEIQLEKLEYDPSNSQKYLKNIQMKGREKVGDDHHLNIAVGSSTENFSKLNDSKQSDDLSRKMDFKNKIKSEEQNNEFSHKFTQEKTDGGFLQSNWHNQLETHSAKVQVKDIPSPVPDIELEEWESILDNLPSVLSDYKRDDLHKDELLDQGNGEDSRRQVFRTVHNGLYMEQHESETEDDQPNWRDLFLNSLDDDREKILLEEYTSVLRNFKGVKMKLNDAEKKRRASHFQYVVQMKVLKNANALKDAQILSLQHRLNSLQSKGVETTNFNEMPKEATSQAAEVQSRHYEEKTLPEFSDKSLTHSIAPEDTRISVIKEDSRDIEVTDVDETHSFTTVEEKVRMDIDDLLEENIELWLRFSTSFHQLHKFQTSVQDLQAEINKVKEDCKQETGQPQSLLSGIRPIYRHLREIQAELTLWLDHNAVLKDDLQNRLSSLSNILDVITRLSRSGSKENDPVLNAYQAAKFQGEILNMKQENNKLAGELEVGFECIRKLQDEIRSTLSNLDEELGLKDQPTRPRSRIPLRSFLFGVKLKNKRPSLFSCVNPALQKQSSDLTAP
ncbi:uncharacterized protein LOC132627630 [Lycium barbarum]|uniref:uncharacterized protein LOC132627630 n=1 Tax=Lycium barbarum TaxID=112863 RepID=UPI00293F79EF|nr:uncharacterized protein LOC132627630 [Lycium barbarum]